MFFLFYCTIFSILLFIMYTNRNNYFIYIITIQRKNNIKRTNVFRLQLHCTCVSYTKLVTGKLQLPRYVKLFEKYHLSIIGKNGIVM